MRAGIPAGVSATDLIWQMNLWLVGFHRLDVTAWHAVTDKDHRSTAETTVGPFPAVFVAGLAKNTSLNLTKWFLCYSTWDHSWDKDHFSIPCFLCVMSWECGSLWWIWGESLVCMFHTTFYLKCVIWVWGSSRSRPALVNFKKTQKLKKKPLLSW